MATADSVRQRAMRDPFVAETEAHHLLQIRRPFSIHGHAASCAGETGGLLWEALQLYPIRGMGRSMTAPGLGRHPPTPVDGGSARRAEGGARLGAGARPYRRASAARGVFELAITLLPFVALWAAMLIAVA